MTERKGHILANALHYIAGQGAIAFFGIITSAVVARYVPKSTFGIYTYFISVATLALPFLDMGAHSLYAVRGARDRDSIGRSWARVLAIKFYSIPLTAIVLAVCFLAADPSLRSAYWLVMLFAVSQSVLLSTDVVFRASERGRSWAVRRTVYETSAFIFLVVAVVIFHVNNATIMLMLAILAILISGTWAVFTVVRVTGLTLSELWTACRQRIDLAELRALWPFAGYTILSAVYYRGTNVLLENYGKQSELADFRVCFIVLTAALYISKAVIWSSTPRIALYDEQLDRERYKSLIHQVAGVNTFIAVFLTVGGLIYGERMIAIAFGHKYAHLGALWVVLDLTLGLLFVQQFCTDLLSNIRQERHAVLGLLVGSLALGALNVLLLPRYGALGGAYAQLGAAIVVVPMNLWVLTREVGVGSLRGVALWRLAVVGIVASAIGLLLLKVNFFLSVVVFVLIFGGMGYLFGALPAQFVRLADRLMAPVLRRIG